MANCNKCKSNRCGCGDSALGIPATFSNCPTVCPPDSEKCTEVFLAQCICWQGPDICELDIKTGDRLDEVLRKLILTISQVSCKLKGETGDSAYAEWLEQGNIGSEQQFLDSLIGPTGADSIVPGPPGLDGLDGNIWLNGNNIPLVTLGNDDDYYLDDITGDYYKKILGVWVYQGTLEGIQGIQGPPGPASIIWEASNVGLNLVTGILIPSGNAASGSVTTLNTIIDYTLPTPDIAFINFMIEMEFVCNAGDAARIEIDLSPYVNLFPISQTAFGISTSIWRKTYSSGAAIQTHSSLDGTGLLTSAVFNLPITELTPEDYWVAGQITVRLN